MAIPAGFEPATLCLEGRCSSPAELRDHAGMRGSSMVLAISNPPNAERGAIAVNGFPELSRRGPLPRSRCVREPVHASIRGPTKRTGLIARLSARWPVRASPSPLSGSGRLAHFIGATRAAVMRCSDIWPLATGLCAEHSFLDHALPAEQILHPDGYARRVRKVSEGRWPGRDVAKSSWWAAFAARRQFANRPEFYSVRR